ncbi:hypothetical protein O7634_01955 [Micromonospora sp. WMMD1120]|uniref:hypothetical protein n=1 Tax=Micromonospora sp. WMMD1120 TaxID=3016106 RepID=UPI002415ADE4|nr:hypothetical protein [Micromonospora sp. WMMD1120]MDG4805522.1 hypothetical protein [Micromonospora sp. WMMD1120]
MAHGEAEYGCAQGEPSRPGHHDPQATGKQRRPVGGPSAAHPVDPLAGRPDDEPVLPRQRSAEPGGLAVPDSDDPSGCLSELPGWAGAHRHGPVRPRPRTIRRERPPRRWC